MNLAVSNPYPSDVKFTASDDIERALSAEGVSEIVKGKMATYQVINISEAMKNLTQVGKLLQLAFSASKGFKCNTPVTAIMCDYQSVIKDSSSVSSNFVLGSLAALKFHSNAIKLAENNRWEHAVAHISKCAEMAGMMAENAQALVVKSEDLCAKSKQALLAATEDETVTIQKKKEVTKILGDLKSQEAKLKEKSQGLTTAIEEEKTREKSALEDAKQASQNALIVGIIGAIAQPLHGIAGSFQSSNPEAAAIISHLRMTMEKADIERKEAQKELENAQTQLAIKKAQLNHVKNEEKEGLDSEIAVLEAELLNKQKAFHELQNVFKSIQAEFHKQAETAGNQASMAALRCAELRKEQIAANADLAESVSKFKCINIEKDDLSLSITSLELVVKTLGKIKTVFENTRTFWEGVKRQCSALTDVDMIKVWAEAEDKEELIGAIKESGLCWLSLGKINLLAANAIREVDASVDHIMSDLPSTEEAKLLVNSLSNSLLAQIKEENANLIQNK